MYVGGRDLIEFVRPVEENAVVAVHFVPGKHRRHVFHIGQAAHQAGVGVVLHLLEIAFAHRFGLKAFQFFPHDFFDLRGVGIRAQVYRHAKFRHVLVGRIRRLHAHGELFFLNQAPVESAGTAIQNALGNVQRVQNLVAHGRRREHERIQVRSVRTLYGQALFAGLLGVANRERRERLACRNRAKVLLDHFHGGGRIDVTCQHENRIARLVILAIMFVGHFARQVHDVAWPADCWHAVRERLVNHGIQRFVVAACGLVVVAHAAFFAHNHAFGIEFAQHGVLHAVGFQPHEQFNFILRERHDVGGHEVAGEGVEPRTACGLVSAPKFVLHKNLAVFVHHGIMFGGKLFHLRGIARQNRRTDECLQAILHCHELGVGNAVGNAHLLGALKEFMFQNVCQARLARDFVHGTCHVEQAATYRRSLLVRVQKHRKAVRQDFFVNHQVHLCKRLRKQGSGQRHTTRNFIEPIHYGSSPLFFSLANLTISSAISFAFCVSSL